MIIQLPAAHLISLMARPAEDRELAQTGEKEITAEQADFRNETHPYS